MFQAMTFTVIGLCSMLSAGDLPQADFVVAPSGSDAGAGTAAEPFATLSRAKEAVRKQIVAGLTKDLVVLVRGGTYSLNEPLLFAPDDSGTTQFSVSWEAWPGEKPLIEGGVEIKDWTRGKHNLWTTKVAGVENGALAFRQLFRDGVRLDRSRHPNKGEFLRVKEVSPDVKTITFDQDIKLKKNTTGAELVVHQNWSISRVAIESHTKDQIVTRNSVGWIGHGDATTASPDKPAYIEKAPEYLDKPGEWYLDLASGEVTYVAHEGENPNEHRFMVARLSQLMVVAGEPGRPVRNLHFKGLAFERTEWALPDFGYLGIQAGHHGTDMSKPTYVTPVAIEFTRATDCSMELCRVGHTGASGIGVGVACQQIHINGCEVYDTAGNGIMVGWRGKGALKETGKGEDNYLSADWDDPAEAPRDNQVTNCTIHHCAAVFHGCVGIGDMFSQNTLISRNYLTELPYTGISVGFRWDESETTERGCVVENNLITEVMQVLADGGGIYTLGFQPGAMLKGNVIWGVRRSPFTMGGAPNNGIFFDQGSKAIKVEENVIYETSGDSVRFNQTSQSNMASWEKNSFGPRPGDQSFPSEIADAAGPMPEYRSASYSAQKTAK
jgi:hypothetical protein